MPAPTVHEPRSTGIQPKDGDGVLHLAVMAPNLFEQHPLPVGGTVSVGRDDSADVRITDELASRLHVRFHIESDGTLTVEDLQSSNGTFLRGERIETGPAPAGSARRGGDGRIHAPHDSTAPRGPTAPPFSWPRRVRGTPGRRLRPRRWKRRDAGGDPGADRKRGARRRGRGSGRGRAAARAICWPSTRPATTRRCCSTPTRRARGRSSKTRPGACAPPGSPFERRSPATPPTAAPRRR